MLCDQLILLAACFLANFFSAFSGGGAGIIQFPVLIFLGLPFSVALATHKVATVALGFGAAFRHFRENSVSLRESLLIFFCGIPGVILGANLILKVPERGATVVLGVLTIGLAVYSICKRGLGVTHCPKHCSVFGTIIGGVGIFFIGMYNGSFTSGAGLFLTLWLVTWFGLDFKRAVAHTFVIGGIFWNSAGAITLGFLAEIHWPWIPTLIIAALLGGYAGAHAGIVSGSRWIKRAFEAVTLIVGAKLLWG